MRVLLFFFFMSLPLQIATGADLISGRYDHEMHNEKVFKPLKVDCAHCHNFAVDPKTRKALPNADFSKSILKLPLKQICHECHRSNESKFKAAPQACITCHRSLEGMKVIKPQNHESLIWKKTHATEARVAGDSCTSCHMTSQCVKCHLQRNEADQRNHTRNFKFTHSIEARMQPQRCDSCHTKSYCTQCHMGKRQ